MIGKRYGNDLQRDKDRLEVLFFRPLSDDRDFKYENHGPLLTPIKILDQYRIISDIWYSMGGH